MYCHSVKTSLHPSRKHHAQCLSYYNLQHNLLSTKLTELDDDGRNCCLFQHSVHFLRAVSFSQQVEGAHVTVNVNYCGGN
jgi:hypothetical protein